MSMYKPFFINSNICLEQKDVSSLNKFILSVAGNTGNSYITYSLIKSIFGGLVNINHIQNIYEYDFLKQEKDIEFINQECTHVFLILQDQIRIAESYGLQLPYQNIINFIKKLNKPVIIAGLGANSFNGFDQELYKKLNPELINFLKEISNHSEVIGIRGHYTEDVLSKIGINNTQVIGCPSFYEMGRERIIQKKEYTKDLRVLLTNYMDKFIKPDSQIILQDESKIIAPIAFNQLVPGSIDMNELNLLLKKRYHIFSSIEKWKEFVSGFDFTIGCRVHGSILALNSGACPVIMNSDSRAREMAELMMIPYYPELANERNIKKIYDVCNYDELNKNYPSLYDNYLNFLKKNGVTIPNHSQSIEANYIQQPCINLYTKSLLGIRIKLSAKNFIQNIFSVKNECSKKVVRLFGIRIKFKRKKRIA